MVICPLSVEAAAFPPNSPLPAAMAAARSFRPAGAVKKGRGERGVGFAFPRLTPMGYYLSPLQGSIGLNGFLFAAPCVLGLLCAGSVAFLTYPRFASAFSAVSAVRHFRLGLCT